MTEDKKHKFEIGYTQSVSSGIIAFHAKVNTDDLNDSFILSKIQEQLEKDFKNKGYLIASDIEPKKDKKNGSK